MSDISTPLPEYTELQERLALPNTLMGGTAAMRKAGDKYLPQEPAESTKAWEFRRDRTTLFNAFKRTIEKLKGEVFSKDVTLGDDVSQQIKDWCEDIDLQGLNISRFSQGVFKGALKDKVSYILVDYPAGEIAPRRLDGRLTQEDINRAGRRPWWVLLTSDRVIGPPQYQSVNGKQIMVQVRFTENQTVPDGDYGVKEVKRIRVMKAASFDSAGNPLTDELGNPLPASYEVWEEQDEGGKTEWIMIESGPITLGFIPLIPVIFGDEPPVEDLAYLNLAHWQLDSDYRQTLYQMVPMWFAKGIVDAQGKAMGEDGNQVITGAGRFIHTTNTEGDLKGIALSSDPAKAMEAELKNIEDRMALFGLTLMLPKGGQVTATQSASDKSENDSALRGWAMILKDCLEVALSYTAQWAKLEAKVLSVTVNTDFRVFSGVELQYLTQAMIAGKIPMGLWLKEAQRRGAVGDDVDETEVMAMLENEMRSGGFAGLAGSILTPKVTAAGVTK